MTLTVPRFLVLLAVLSTAVRADSGGAPVPTPTPAPGAQPPTSDASAVVLADKPNSFFKDTPSDSDETTRAVSPTVAAALAEGMPKFSPPTPTPTPVADDVDMRDVDKPKNEIKRLPKYVVQESRPPIFRKQDLYTQNGLMDLEFKVHPGLVFGNILGLNENVAAQMLQDEQRLENMADLKDTAHAMMLGGDASEGQYILQQSQQTYMRTNDDWMTSGPGAPGDWVK